MNRLTLEWAEAGQLRTQTITDQSHTKNSQTFRIGRDPALCDGVISHPTISKLHIEIFFVPQQNGFYLRNLRETNPPLLNGQPVIKSAVELRRGTTIRLGELDLTVKEIQLANLIAPTFVAVPVGVAAPSPLSSGQPIVELSYGLQCPKCHRVSPYEHLEVGCAWCGTSLAAAHSVLRVPSNS